MLRSAGIVVGPHDEVLEPPTHALNLGLTRGSRVAIARILEMVREVRREQRMITEELQLDRGAARDADLLSGSGSLRWPTTWSWCWPTT